MSLLIVCSVMLILLVLGMPVALIMGFSGLTYFLVTGSFDYFPMIVTRLYGGIDSFTLICIPFFILAGDMMSRSGITDRLVKFSNLLVGKMPGNLAQANVLASGIFASISGSALGDIAAIGSVFIPAMKKEGYGSRFSAAVTGCQLYCESDYSTEPHHHPVCLGDRCQHRRHVRCCSDPRLPYGGGGHDHGPRPVHKTQVSEADGKSVL